jgi:hypothetical protein
MKSPRTGLEHKTYAETDIDAIKRRLAQPAVGRHVDREGAWLDVASTKRELGVHRQTLTAWEGGCGYLDGEPLRSKKECGRHGGEEMWYFEDDVYSIKEAMAQPEGVYGSADDPYLTPAAVAEDKRFGYGRQTLLGWENHCPFLPAGKLPTRLFTDKHNATKQRKTYRVADLLRVSRARKVRFDGCYETAAGRRFNLARASKECGLSSACLRNYVRKSPYLPERHLPFKRKRPPRDQGKREFTVLESDLKRLMDAIEAAHNYGQLDGNWKSSEEIAGHYKILEPSMQRTMRSMLCEWRRDGVLAAKQVRPRHGGAPFWIYDVNQIDRLLTRPVGLASEVAPEGEQTAEGRNGPTTTLDSNGQESKSAPLAGSASLDAVEECHPTDHKAVADAMLSCAELARHFGVDPETLRFRLLRWQRTSDEGWIEVANRKPREPRYRYRVSAVMPIVESLRANGERTAKTNCPA